MVSVGEGSRWARPVLLALPGVTLAAAGLFHPHHLTYDTSWRWFALHVPGLLVFPLVGAALAALVSHRQDPIAWIVRLAAYVYATFYTALDVISGIGAGWVTHQLGPDVPRPEAVSQMFRIGTPLGRVGEWALLVAVLAIVVDLAVKRRIEALAGVLLVPGAWCVHLDHIFSPTGVTGMVLLGVGTALVAARQNFSPRGATESPVDAS
ncbi:hypothetical protein [Nocardioides acrostichi]|uniref:Uncharacterized protein n=1 Tax=Nocardioides acrostichi TaxID=2784339 RepID=A0A930V2H3_9ACTN|nr:hypothetical protein [Nocardioides acrostichi]MBF4162809.1 hypothetical protein [Nocardioides acrostichi]